MHKKIRYAVRALITLIICLTMLIVGYETFLMLNSDRTYLYVIQQETIEQQISKDALLLEYTSGNNKTLALSELESILNTYETNQSLIVSAANPDNVVPLIKSTTVDYNSIDTAARKIVNSDPTQRADDIQVQIILVHGRSYYSSFNTIANTLLVDETNRVYGIFFTIIIGKVIIIFACLFLWVILERQIPDANEGTLKIHPEGPEKEIGGFSK